MENPPVGQKVKSPDIQAECAKGNEHIFLGFAAVPLSGRKSRRGRPPHTVPPAASIRACEEMWPWVRIYASILGADAHPCTTYFDVTRGTGF